MRLVVILMCCAGIGLVAWRWPVLGVPLGVALAAFVVIGQLVRRSRNDE